jgi:uncharacterized surface protein with fasciclin (FAS1) repeats
MRNSTRIAATVASAGLIAAAMAAPASAARPDWSKKSDMSIVETAIALSTQGDREAGVFDEVHSDFDILIRALLVTEVADIFNGKNYTVFAPTDQAFIDTAEELSGQQGLSEGEAFGVVAGLGLPTVEAVLGYHVTKGVRNSNSVTGAKKVTMLDGGTITARSGSVVAAKSEADFVTGFINVRVSDGMIHVIDNVLLP